MNKIVLIGGGGHCKSVLDALLSNHEYDEIVITDYSIPSGTLIFGCKVVGNDDLLPQLFKDGFSNAFITVGSITSTNLRRKLYTLAIDIGFNLVNIIDNSAIVSNYCKLGKGIFVGKNTVINADVKIGDCAIINTGAIVEHECNIGTFAHISPGAIICGEVSIGDDSHIGAGTMVKQQIEVGKNTLIGVGSVVVKNIPNNVIAFGNPCKIKKNI